MIPFAQPGVPADCPILPLLREHVAGECDRCGKALSGRRKRWCSNHCASWAYKEFSKHHDWSAARDATLERDGYKCVRCGAKPAIVDPPQEFPPISTKPLVVLQVNHIEPRRGQGYGRGCHHHLSNLETLCRPCHVVVTNQQRKARAA